MNLRIISLLQFFLLFTQPLQRCFFAQNYIVPLEYLGLFFERLFHDLVLFLKGLNCISYVCLYFIHKFSARHIFQPQVDINEVFFLCLLLECQILNRKFLFDLLKSDVLINQHFVQTVSNFHHIFLVFCAIHSRRKTFELLLKLFLYTLDLSVNCKSRYKRFELQINLGNFIYHLLSILFKVIIFCVVSQTCHEHLKFLVRNSIIDSSLQLIKSLLTCQQLHFSLRDHMFFFLQDLVLIYFVVDCLELLGEVFILLLHRFELTYKMLRGVWE